MRKTQKTQFVLASILTFCFVFPLNAATRQMEKLGRGLSVANIEKGVLLSWRLLGTENFDTEFNLYRDGKKIATIDSKSATNYLDTQGTITSKYSVSSVTNGKESVPSEPLIVLDQNGEGVPYKTIKGIKVPEPQIMPDDSICTYSPNDMSIGDLDGDGELDLVLKWDPSNSKDNSQGGYTGTVFIDGMKLDGTLLWRINLGKNIRAGAHYTQMIVYDLDSDGMAEIALKTSDGTIDGKGNVIGDSTKDYRTSSGTIMSGNEFLTIFKGSTGEAITTINFWPSRGKISGDNYGNRDNRMLAAVAYLDGVHPSLITGRGYYTESYIAAYDFNGQELTTRWQHSSDKKGQGLYGEGNHNLSVGDVNGDGLDEIIYGSSALKPDGTLLYRTGFGHGDAMHLSDLDPDNDGLEVYGVHEEKNNQYSEEMRNQNGIVLWGTTQESAGYVDNGRGLAADIDSTSRGFEMWSGTSGGIRTAKGTLLANTSPSVNFRIYFDGDLQDELLDATGSGGSGGKIEKWNSSQKSVDRYFSFYKINNSTLNNYTKANPCISADLFGDWREEFIVRSSTDPSILTIFATKATTPYRLYTLLHDAQYRLSIAWQNVAYNQPPHTSYYLPDMVKNLKKPDIQMIEPNLSTPPKRASTVDASTPNEGIGITEATNEGFLQNGYYNFENSEESFASWNLNSTQATQTTISVRYSNGGTRARNMILKVNGKEIGEVAMPSTGSWTIWKTVDATINLVEGLNTLTLNSTMADGGANIDLFYFDVEGIELFNENSSQVLPQIHISHGAYFTPSTKTLYTPNAGFAEVYFYDLKGNMRLGISKNVMKGMTLLPFDPKDLPKGIYILKVKINGYVKQQSIYTSK